VVLVVLIDGMDVRAKEIPQQQLRSAWKLLSSGPFPKVQAFRLVDEDFDRIIRFRQCEEDLQRELEEWNRILTTEGTDACVFNTEKSSDAEYIILVRKHPYHSLKEILAHELAHIARGDLD